MSDWTDVFSNSRVNGAHYTGDLLPQSVWKWPESWLEEQLRRTRGEAWAERTRLEKGHVGLRHLTAPVR
ncbi:MAG: hypothetical protein HY695_19765 [Deltaproteobacteria bacterium]|nr:hypothetical protein [Deltaproteobacteria bacterium]